MAAVEAVLRAAMPGGALAQQGLDAARVQQVEARANEARLLLASGGPPWPPEVLQQQADALYNLASECFGLANCAEASMDDEGGEEEEVSFAWMLKATVAEAIANSLAGIATGLDFGGRSAPGADLEFWASELLQRVAMDFDYFALFVFGGLCRLAALQTGVGERYRLRVLRALRGVCVWALWAASHAIRYERFTGKVLWEWACCDASWACVLVTGVLHMSLEDLAELQAQSSQPAAGEEPHEAPVVLPADLPELHHAVLTAALGLASPTVAFALGRDAENDVHIAARNATLAEHRSALASAAVTCRLPEALIEACWRWRTAPVGPSLAAFVLSLCQPELTADRVEAEMLTASSPAAAGVVEKARRTMTALVGHMSGCSERLWQVLAATFDIAGGVTPPGFLQDCADLAHFLCPSLASLTAFVEACLLWRPSDIAAAVAALCVLASNADVAPQGAMLEVAPAALAQAVVNLAPEEREAVLERWGRWRGPVRIMRLQGWASLWHAALPASEPPPPPPPMMLAPPEAEAFGAEEHEGLGLQGLASQAPKEYRCSLDGQLMLDPVQTPQRLMFERSSLAAALASNGGRCPITGEPLELQSCRRIPELRRAITRWVQKRPPPGSLARPQLPS